MLVAGIVGFAGNELVAQYRIRVGRRIGSAALVAAAREVYRRLMDAVDPALVDQAETALRAVDGVRDVTAVRLRWIGHRLHAEADLVVDAHLSLVAAHEIAADAEHQLTHAVPRLTTATVHTDPHSHPGAHHHTDLSHQRRNAGEPVTGDRH